MVNHPGLSRAGSRYYLMGTGKGAVEGHHMVTLEHQRRSRRINILTASSPAFLYPSK